MGTVFNLHRTISVIFDSLDLDLSSTHGDEDDIEDVAIVDGLGGGGGVAEVEIDDARGLCPPSEQKGRIATGAPLRGCRNCVATIEALFSSGRSLNHITLHKASLQVGSF